jgi:hypothetical protein
MGADLVVVPLSSFDQISFQPLAQYFRLTSIAN